jgi:hypothetical protein
VDEKFIDKFGVIAFIWDNAVDLLIQKIGLLKQQDEAPRSPASGISAPLPQPGEYSGEGE